MDSLIGRKVSDVLGYTTYNYDNWLERLKQTDFEENLEPIKLCFDVKILNKLAIFINPVYTPYEIFKEIENGGLDPKKYENVPVEVLPAVLQDKWLGKVVFNKDKKQNEFANLLDMYTLCQALANGHIEICVTENAKEDVKYNDLVSDFIDRYVTILHVENNDKKEFKKRRMDLIKQYEEAEVFNFDPTRKDSSPAKLIADCAILGMVFVTSRENDFIHKFKMTKDYIRANEIELINKNNGYVYLSNTGELHPAKPISLRALVYYIRHFEKYKDKKAFYFLENNIGTNGVYIPSVNTVAI